MSSCIHTIKIALLAVGILLGHSVRDQADAQTDRADPQAGTCTICDQSVTRH